MREKKDQIYEFVVIYHCIQVDCIVQARTALSWHIMILNKHHVLIIPKEMTYSIHSSVYRWELGGGTGHAPHLFSPSGHIPIDLNIILMIIIMK